MKICTKPVWRLDHQFPWQRYFEFFPHSHFLPQNCFHQMWHRTCNAILIYILNTFRHFFRGEYCTKRFIIVPRWPQKFIQSSQINSLLNFALKSELLYDLYHLSYTNVEHGQFFTLSMSKLSKFRILPYFEVSNL